MKKGRTLSPEHRAKIAAAQKGHTLSPESRTSSRRHRRAGRGGLLAPSLAKISAARKGRTRSPETCAKLSAAQKGRTLARASAKIAAAQKGHTLSPETRAKLSAAQKGRPGRPLSPETLREALGRHSRGVLLAPSISREDRAHRRGVLLAPSLARRSRRHGRGVLLAPSLALDRGGMEGRSLCPAEPNHPDGTCHVAGSGDETRRRAPRAERPAFVRGRPQEAADTYAVRTDPHPPSRRGRRD